jgi:NAD(P)-dependent dehydrogenase (short-subunit alcohol dehydrogenase family)
MPSAEDLVVFENPPDLRFDDKVVWITGASRGLGRTLACAFAGAGATVVLSARSLASLEEVAGLIGERGGAVTIFPGSVTEPADIATAVAGIEAEHGRLDSLVNNAGISPYFTRAEKLELDDLREVLETNLVGAFACARAAAGLLRADGGGSIVNVSSIHGSRSHIRMLAYAAAKGGMEMMTRTLAEEWAGAGIRVNSLAPGYIETEMTDALRAHPGWSQELLDRTPLGRFATRAEIAACALFLAGPVSSYVTGATLFADGGWTAR